jgi:hypothetical protein
MKIIVHLYARMDAELVKEMIRLKSQAEVKEDKDEGKNNRVDGGTTKGKYH